MESFRNFERIVEEGDSTLPRYRDTNGDEWLDRGRVLTLCSTRSCSSMPKTPENLAKLKCIANCPEKNPQEHISENIPALNQPLGIGKAAVSVGGLSLEDGYLYYTIDGKRPTSASDIEKLANPGSVLRHHFKQGSDINRVTNIINQAQQGHAIKIVTSQREHPAKAFFDAGLAFRMSPDIKNNAVKLVVSEAPHLRRKEDPGVAPGLPPQR